MKYLAILLLFSIHGHAFNERVFQRKLKYPPPEWMHEQINEDLSPFQKLGITQQALDETLKKSATTILINWREPNRYDLFARYRIIDNKIYRKNHAIATKYFDNVLVTLSKSVTLPNVDFILSLSNGAPEDYSMQDFWITEDPDDQAPLFARSKRTWAKYMAIFPDHTAFNLSSLNETISKANKKYPWSSKIKKAFWRGVPSDFGENQVERFSLDEIRFLYSKKPRFIVSKYSVFYPDLVDAGIISSFEHAPNLGIFLNEEQVMKSKRSLEDHVAYAYLPCLDGRSCTYTGYYWRLLSSSVVLKPDSDQQLWFYKALKPNVHYIPMKPDCSDLLEKIEWAKNNDKACQKMVRKANKLVLENLTEEDSYLYVYRALKYYKTLQKFNCEDLKQETSVKSQWIKLN